MEAGNPDNACRGVHQKRMSDWASQIESDLAWREAEIASLKLLAASSPARSNRQRALLRAMWAMLYAHYEGFCKFCWDLFLAAIETEGPARKELRVPIAKFSLLKVFKTLRGDASDDKLWDFFHGDLAIHLAEPAAFPVKLETKSNLWANLAIENNDAVGLSCQYFGQLKAQLNRLVNQRNEIAHGKKLVIGSLSEYQPYEDAAFLAMHEVAVAVVECLEKKTYLESVYPQ
jgi:MAE_28990/MAE_18760-like HEPN